MSNEELIAQGNRLIEQINKSISSSLLEIISSRIEGTQFLRDYAGEDSSFYKEVSNFNHLSKNAGFDCNITKMSIQAFVRYLENDLVNGISPKRQAQIEVVSDILEQASNLLEDNKIHAAAPAVLIGAALEEFLRNWIEAKNIELGSAKPGIDSYAKLLRENELITKQEKKDIDSWAGNRNNAAHGIWQEVEDRRLINIMLQSVSFFISKHRIQ